MFTNVAGNVSADGKIRRFQAQRTFHIEPQSLGKLEYRGSFYDGLHLVGGIVRDALTLPQSALVKHYC